MTGRLFRVSAGLTSAPLCHARFPTAENSSHRWFLWVSLLCPDQFCSAPDHETTVVSHVKNLVVLCARSLQHHTILSVHPKIFFSEIEANHFYRNIGNAFTTDCLMEPSVCRSTSDQNSEKMFVHCSYCCPDSFSSIHPAWDLLMATRSKLPRVLLLNYHMFDPNLHVIRPKSSYRSVGRNSSCHLTKNRPCESGQWGHLCAGS